MCRTLVSCRAPGCGIKVYSISLLLCLACTATLSRADITPKARITPYRTTYFAMDVYVKPAHAAGTYADRAGSSTPAVMRV